MSEPENFLARWSRRKADAGRDVEPARETAPEPVTPDEVVPASSKEHEGAAKEETEVDLSKLPSLDSIGPGTDIRAFLQKGVPSDLARAALRRVWTSDPAIRDFIGIAENQYDFATGSDIPGFGPLAPTDDVARMVAEITREGVPRAPAASETESKAAPEKTETAEQDEAPADVVADEVAESDLAAATEADASQGFDVASQQIADEPDDEVASAPRSHGSALPR